MDGNVNRSTPMRPSRAANSRRAIPSTFSAIRRRVRCRSLMGRIPINPLAIYARWCPLRPQSDGVAV